MRTTWWLSCLVGMLLTGCGQANKTEVRPPVGPTSGESLYGARDGRHDWQQDPAAARHQGHTAAEWSAQLLNPAASHAVRYEAAQALASLDNEAGTRLLMLALKDKNPEVRLHALQALQPHHVSQDKEQAPYLIDQFLGMLKDPNPAIRQEAAFRLSWFDQTTSSRLIPGPMAKQRLDALQATYHFDGNRQVQLAARNSIISLYDHMRGTLDCPPGNNLFIDPQ